MYAKVGRRFFYVFVRRLKEFCCKVQINIGEIKKTARTMVNAKLFIKIGFRMYERLNTVDW